MECDNRRPCPGYVQANLVMLPAALADDFEAFCAANPQPCPLLERTSPGAYERRGSPPAPTSAATRPDIACTWTARRAAKRPRMHWRTGARTWWLPLGLQLHVRGRPADCRLPLRHLKQDVIVPMYRTSVACTPVGPFAGPMVVSMRPMPADRVDEAHAISARYPRVHGAPVHAGDPAALGIADIATPDWGDPVEVRADEVPVFWACGVTPQAVAQASRPPLMITHAPGHMFLTDWRDHQLAGEEPALG